MLDLVDIIVEALACGRPQGDADSWAGKAEDREAVPDDDSVKELATSAWKPGDFANRSQLGERN